MLHGRYLLLKLGNTTVASCKECSFSHDIGLIETSNSLQYYKTYTTGRKGWKVSCNYLVASTSAMKTALGRPGTTYSFQLRQGDPGGTSTLIASGSVICTAVKITGQVGNLISGSFEFQGNGNLTVSS